jgi:glycosyltransferase involved in cell wall biosynthesis
MKQNKLLVLGNGPSLKQEFFPNFRNVPCLGMNAAYRYWQRIDWYPEIYCCLDDQVVLSHADAIMDMISRQLCKSFFLHPDLLQRFPALANAHGVFFLPQLRPGKNDKEFCEKHGLAYLPQPVFASQKPGKLTTGSYAVRFAAFLGFKNIGLIGIDCRYTEVIKEANAVEGIVLEISTTPRKNTNYFFDDYQIKGDRYNIPNPGVHQGNLHLQSFEVLRNDIEHYKFDLEVNICSPESEIYDQRVFPYLPLGDFVAEPNLSAIFVPFVNADLDRMLGSLTRWGCQEFAPYRSVSSPTVELHLAYNGSQDAALEETIAVTYCRAGLSRYFSGLYFHYSNLEGLRDLYTRKFEGPVGPEGYMAGPNNQFFDIIERFSMGMSHIAVMEADAIPIRANWLRAIEDIVSGSERFWICGSHYRGIAQIQSFSHINGNAIYNVGDQEFRQFFRDSFLRHFYQRVKSVPSLCYDIVLHDMFHPIFAGKSNKDLFDLWSKVAHRFRFSEYIVDVSHGLDRQQEALLTLTDARRAYPDAYLLHGAIAKIESATPARIQRSDQVPATVGTAPAVSVVMLDPDALGNFGHYLAYDDQLKTALVPYGVSFRVLANRQLPSSISGSRGFFVPCLSDHSWTIGIPNKDTQQIDPSALGRFEAEVGSFLRSSTEPKGDSAVRLYMYCAGIPHAQAISRLIEGLPQVSAVVNLFYLPFQDITRREFLDYWAPVLKKLNEQERLLLTLPTDTLAHDLRAICGIELPVTPHPSPTISDSLFARIQRCEFNQRARRDSRITVLFPGAPTQGKAQDAGIAAANLIAATRLDGHDLHIVMRDARKKDTPASLAALYETLHPAVETFKGQLSNREFLDVFMAADIVVLPYAPSMFKYRNSGLLVDAIYCGKPVVAVKGTWLGNMVDRTGCGLTVPADSPQATAEAIRTVAKNLDAFAQTAISAARAYFVENSWEKLALLVANPAARPLVAYPVAVAALTPIPQVPAPQRQIPSDIDIRRLTLDTSPHFGSIRFSKVIPGTQFTSIEQAAWRYRPPTTNASSPWIAVFDLDVEATSGFIAGLTLRSTCEMQVRVSLARFGDAPYEGSHKTILLHANTDHSVVCGHLFSRHYSALKIQIDILSMDAASANISVSRMFMNESIGGVRERLSNCKVDLSTANQLFRRGDYVEAMALYLGLNEKRPLKIYAENAIASARKLKWGGVSTVQDLVQRLNA